MVYGAPVSLKDMADIDSFINEFLSKEHFETLISLDDEDMFDEVPKGGMLKYIKSTVLGVFAHIDEIDGAIQKNSEGWKISRISKTAMAVLRVAVYELLYSEDVPIGVAINSAVEIDKGYDDEKTVSFVNGVLGSVAKQLA